MSKQLPTDEQKKELHLILETGDALQVRQLVRIGFPEIDAYNILRKSVQNEQDGPEIWTQLGYKERRTKPSWLRNLQRCNACGTLVLFIPHEAFFCGHLDCQWKDASYCPICGPVFDQLWGFLCREGPEGPKIEWPSTPDNLFDETKLRSFAGAVVQTHRLALQKIPIEVLVSFALNRSSTGITLFLESHKKLAIQVEESRADAARIWAWDRASREVYRFELLEQAIQAGLCGKSEKWNVLDPTENSLYTKKLSPIREMFERYSPSEFLKRLPLLSRRFMREGSLDTDFSIYDEIIEYSSRRVDENIMQAWLQRSREIHEYCVQLLGKNVPDGKEYFQHCKKVLRDDVLDILSVYPNLVLVLTELAEVLYLHGDLLSCGIIITSIEQLFGSVATKWNMDFTNSVIGAKKSVVPFEIRS